MSKKIKISNFQDFKNLNRREIMSFDKNKNHHILKDNIDHKEIIKGLRHVHRGFDKVDLRHPLSKHFKNKSEKILNDYFEFSRRENVQVIQPRKKNRKLIGQLAQQSGKWKKFYIPNEGTGKSKISYTRFQGKRIAKVSTNVADYLMLYFDMIALLNDSDAEIERVLKGFKPKTKKKFTKNFKIMAGNHLINNPFGDKKQLKREISKLMLKYNGQEGASDHQEWLFGIKAIYEFVGKTFRIVFNKKTKLYDVFFGNKLINSYKTRELAQNFINKQK